MSDAFFTRPILNSPYQYPSRHWQLDEHGQPTGHIAEGRRKASFVTPIPKPKKQSRGQIAIGLDEGKGLSTESQQHDIRSLRSAELRSSSAPSSAPLPGLIWSPRPVRPRRRDSMCSSPAP